MQQQVIERQQDMIHAQQEMIRDIWNMLKAKEMRGYQPYLGAHISSQSCQVEIML